MPPHPSPLMLRLEPHAIPALRLAFEEALTDLDKSLIHLQRDGYIDDPWLGDETSSEVRRYYNERVMLAKDGPAAALLAYQSELIKVRDTLAQMEQEYHYSDAVGAERMAGR